MDGAYIINLGEYKSNGTHWIDLYVNGNNGSASQGVSYFYNCGVKQIPKEIKKLIGNKIIANIYRIFDCIGLIDFLLIGKSLLYIFISYLQVEKG